MKNLIITFVFLFLAVSLFAQSQTFSQSATKTIIHDGVGLGAVIAVVSSWSRSKSVAWAIVHGILSWIYVIYFVITREK